jgi:hypothetical protein
MNKVKTKLNQQETLYSI